MRHDQKMALIIFAVAVAVLLILAAYGYFTGAWNVPPEAT